MSETTASMMAEETEKSGGSKGKPASKKGESERSFDMEELRELADLFDERGLTEFEFENENIRVRLSKMTAMPIQAAAARRTEYSGTANTDNFGRNGCIHGTRIRPFQDHIANSRYLLPFAGTGQRSVCFRGKQGLSGNRGLYRRSDEVDERDPGRDKRRDRGDLCRERPAGGIWPATVRN